MHLQLVPIDGEKSLTDEEKQRKKRRSSPISPELINYFDLDQQKEIKIFISKLIITSEQIHHNIEQIENSQDVERQNQLKHELEKLNNRRIALFDNIPFFLRYFIKLLDLCPSEPWKELEQFLKNIRDEDTANYRQASQSMGIEAAMENSYLLQIEDDPEEKNIDTQMQCRITPGEIENLILHHSLESLVIHLVNARRVSSGEFWDKGFYNL